MASPLFTFAILTDTHIRPAKGDQSSPYQVNKYANARARYAAHAIAQHKPAFTVHLGDMVHPLPHLPSFSDACSEALTILKPLIKNLKFVPGNHDIGDKPHKGSPAESVSIESIALYEKYFGPSNHSFDFEDCHMIIINSSLVNLGSELERNQRHWLEEDLKLNNGKRIFLFSHYPPFITEKNEATHYDNYDQPGRKWLLDLMQKYKVEAVFSGHVHHFFYNRDGDTKYYVLPPTSFTRQDFSEIFNTGPAPEFGRNDIGKFSFALVDIYPDHHLVRVIPTEGRELESHETLEQKYPNKTNTNSYTNRDTPLTVHLRHAWTEAIALPYNGPMEEFSRKRARNDYTLVRLQQMGITQIRTPLEDLINSNSRKRMHDYGAVGFTFTLFSQGVPTLDQWALCDQHSDLIKRFEIVSSDLNLSDIKDMIAKLSPIKGIDLYIGLAHSSVHESQQGSKFAHSVSFGFKLKDREVIADKLLEIDTKSLFDGLVFQLNLDESLKESLIKIDEFANERQQKTTVNIRLANTNPAIASFDDNVIKERVKQIISMADNLKHTNLQLDTFADIDRGYHPRHGLVDRLYNLRLAGLFLAGFTDDC